MRDADNTRDRVIGGYKLETNDAEERVTEHQTGAESRYWSKFYEHEGFDTGSTFFEFINNIDRLPSTLVDIGCGEGRDSFAFASAGRTVLALDRSKIGVEHGNNKSRSGGLSDHLSFAACDVSDSQNLTNNLELARAQSKDGSLCYYMRFFLHSIPEDTQKILLDTITQHAQPGDVFTAEFRTDKDELLDKEFGNSHYRRYQNAQDFSTELSDALGWDILFETESRGLSPYKNEDPALYRVVAARP